MPSLWAKRAARRFHSEFEQISLTQSGKKSIEIGAGKSDHILSPTALKVGTAVVVVGVAAVAVKYHMGALEKGVVGEGLRGLEGLRELEPTGAKLERLESTIGARSLFSSSTHTYAEARSATGSLSTAYRAGRAGAIDTAGTVSLGGQEVKLARNATTEFRNATTEFRNATSEVRNATAEIGGVRPATKLSADMHGVPTGLQSTTRRLESGIEPSTNSLFRPVAKNTRPVEFIETGLDGAPSAPGPKPAVNVHTTPRLVSTTEVPGRVGRVETTVARTVPGKMELIPHSVPARVNEPEMAAAVRERLATTTRTFSDGLDRLAEGGGKQTLTAEQRIAVVNLQADTAKLVKASEPERRELLAAMQRNMDALPPDYVAPLQTHFEQLNGLNHDLSQIAAVEDARAGLASSVRSADLGAAANKAAAERLQQNATAFAEGRLTATEERQIVPQMMHDFSAVRADLPPEQANVIESQLTAFRESRNALDGQVATRAFAADTQQLQREVGTLRASFPESGSETSTVFRRSTEALQADSERLASPELTAVERRNVLTQMQRQVEQLRANGALPESLAPVEQNIARLSAANEVTIQSTCRSAIEEYSAAVVRDAHSIRLPVEAAESSEVNLARTRLIENARSLTEPSADRTVLLREMSADARQLEAAGHDVTSLQSNIARLDQTSGELNQATRNFERLSARASEFDAEAGSGVRGSVQSPSSPQSFQSFQSPTPERTWEGQADGAERPLTHTADAAPTDRLNRAVGDTAVGRGAPEQLMADAQTPVRDIEGAGRPLKEGSSGTAQHVTSNEFGVRQADAVPGEALPRRAQANIDVPQTASERTVVRSTESHAADLQATARQGGSVPESGHVGGEQGSEVGRASDHSVVAANQHGPQSVGKTAQLNFAPPTESRDAGTVRGGDQHLNLRAANSVDGTATLNQAVPRTSALNQNVNGLYLTVSSSQQHLGDISARAAAIEAAQKVQPVPVGLLANHRAQIYGYGAGLAAMSAPAAFAAEKTNARTGQSDTIAGTVSADSRSGASPAPHRQATNSPSSTAAVTGLDNTADRLSGGNSNNALPIDVRSNNAVGNVASISDTLATGARSSSVAGPPQLEATTTNAAGHVANPQSSNSADLTIARQGNESGQSTGRADGAAPVKDYPTSASLNAPSTVPAQSDGNFRNTERTEPMRMASGDSSTTTNVAVPGLVSAAQGAVTVSPLMQAVISEVGSHSGQAFSLMPVYAGNIGGPDIRNASVLWLSPNQAVFAPGKSEFVPAEAAPASSTLSRQSGLLASLGVSDIVGSTKRGRIHTPGFPNPFDEKFSVPPTIAMREAQQSKLSSISGNNILGQSIRARSNAASTTAHLLKKEVVAATDPSRSVTNTKAPAAQPAQSVLAQGVTNSQPSTATAAGGANSSTTVADNIASNALKASTTASSQEEERAVVSG